MRMEIYCNDGLIVLCEEQPLSPGDNELQVMFSGKKAMKETVIAFEGNQDQKRLVLWSSDKFQEMFAAFFGMHEMVQAAGGVVFNEHDEILFIHRNGKWDLPKGKISGKDKRKAMKNGKNQSGKQKEDTFDGIARIAALREVKEETGLKQLKILSELPSTYHIYFQKDQRIIKHTRWYRMEGTAEDTIKPQISEGIIIARWIPSNSVGCVFKHTYESLKPLIKSVLNQT